MKFQMIIKNYLPFIELIIPFKDDDVGMEFTTEISDLL